MLTTLSTVLATRSTADLTADAVRELGPFCHRDRNTTDPYLAPRVEVPPVFYVDIDLGVRVELSLPGTVPGLTPDALLVARQDGGWEVFGNDGPLVVCDSDAIRVSVCR